MTSPHETFRPQVQDLSQEEEASLLSHTSSSAVHSRFIENVIPVSYEGQGSSMDGRISRASTTPPQRPASAIEGRQSLHSDHTGIPRTDTSFEGLYPQSYPRPRAGSYASVAGSYDNQNANMDHSTTSNHIANDIISQSQQDSLQADRDTSNRETPIRRNSIGSLLKDSSQTNSIGSHPSQNQGHGRRSKKKSLGDYLTKRDKQDQRRNVVSSSITTKKHRNTNSIETELTRELTSNIAEGNNGRKKRSRRPLTSSSLTAKAANVKSPRVAVDVDPANLEESRRKLDAIQSKPSKQSIACIADDKSTEDDNKVDDEKTESNKRLPNKIKYGLIALIVLCIVAIIVAIIVYLLLKRRRPSPPMAPETPTHLESLEIFGQSASSGYKQLTVTYEPRPSDRKGQIAKRLADEAVTSSKDLEFDTTPQHAALDWIATKDQLKVAPDSDQLPQRYSLAVLYYSMAEDNNPLKDLWLTDKHECEWEYVTCSKNNPPEGTTQPSLRGLEEQDKMTQQYVSGIDFSALQSDEQRILPSELGSLKHLNQLVLSNMNWYGSIPHTFQNLTKLQALLLQENALTGAFPKIDQATNLEILKLQDNRLSGPLPEMLGNLIKLREINLRHNNFRGYFPDVFDNMTQLTRIYIEGNVGLEGSVPPSLCALGTLSDTTLDELSSVFQCDCCRQNSGGASTTGNTQDRPTESSKPEDAVENSGSGETQIEGCCTSNFLDCLKGFECGDTKEKCKSCKKFPSVNWIIPVPMDQCLDEFSECDSSKVDPQSWRCCDGLECRAGDDHGEPQFSICVKPDSLGGSSLGPATDHKFPWDGKPFTKETLKKPDLSHVMSCSKKMGMSTWQTMKQMESLTISISDTILVIQADGAVTSESQAFGLLSSAIALASMTTITPSQFETISDRFEKYFEGWQKMCEASSPPPCQTQLYCYGSPCLPGWKFSSDLSSVIGEGSSSDADSDAITGMIIAVTAAELAAATEYMPLPDWYNRVKDWAERSCTQFLQDNTVLSATKSHRLLTLGECTGGWDQEGNNPSHHAPAHYRIMRDFQESMNNLRPYQLPPLGGQSLKEAWNMLIETSYSFLDAAHCEASGLVPNRAMVTEVDNTVKLIKGDFPTEDIAPNEFGEEASRTLWRVTFDSIVFPKQAGKQAKQLLQPFLDNMVDSFDPVPYNSWEFFKLGSLPNCTNTLGQTYSVRPTWQMEGFMYGPLYSVLSNKLPDSIFANLTFVQKDMVDVSCYLLGVSVENQSYYSKTWQILSTLMLNGDIASMTQLLNYLPT